MGQVLSRPLAGEVAGALDAVARTIAVPPDRAALAVLHATGWPVRDAESLRGAALIEEAWLSGERPERLAADHTRLFHDGPGRRAVAPTAVPGSAAPALSRLRAEMAAAGLLPTAEPAPGLVTALGMLSAVLTAPPHLSAPAAQWRRTLGKEHLPWCAGALTRVQLGAQTFCYQGVGVLGLGLLRWAATA